MENTPGASPTRGGARGCDPPNRGHSERRGVREPPEPWAHAGETSGFSCSLVFGVCLLCVCVFLLGSVHFMCCVWVHVLRRILPRVGQPTKHTV